jgi:hypothetical protein
MSLHFNDHLKSEFIAMLEDLTLEEIAEGLVNNTINYRKFRNKIIKKEFDSIREKTGKNILDVHIDLSEKYFVSDSTIRDAIRDR